MGCDSAVEQNGYPLGNDSSVRSLLRRVRACWPLVFRFERGRFARAAALSVSVAPLPSLRIVRFAPPLLAGAKRSMQLWRFDALSATERRCTPRVNACFALVST